MRPTLTFKKLLMSKWTAVIPEHQEKHFIVIQVYDPIGQSPLPEVYIEIESVYSKRTQIMHWTELKNTTTWIQGWN
jgi:tryptophan-rich hypothetical protein